MLKALLFDLDGTLLSINTDEFVKEYMKSVGEYIKDFHHPEKVVRAIMESTGEMVRNKDKNLSNKEVFEKHFIEKSSIPGKEIFPLFDKYYLEHFPKLNNPSYYSKTPNEIIEIAKEQGRKIVLATNPLFPKGAVIERLSWLEIDSNHFDLITSYETSHFCKPHKDYYEEILTKIDVNPKDAIMIGNDMQEDMFVSELGISTYLVTNNLVDRGTPTYQVNQTGTLEELRDQLKHKNGIFSV